MNLQRKNVITKGNIPSIKEKIHVQKKKKEKIKKEKK